MNKPKVCAITLGCKVNQYESDAIIKNLKDFGFETLEGLSYADYYFVNTCAVTHEAERKSRQMINRIFKLNSNAKIFICGCASQNNAEQFVKNGVVYISGTESKIDISKLIIEDFKLKNNKQIENCNINDSFEKTQNIANVQNNEIGRCFENNKKIFDKNSNDNFVESQNSKFNINLQNETDKNLVIKNNKECKIANSFEIGNIFEENDGIYTNRTRHFLKVQDGCNNFCSYCIIPYLRGRERSRQIDKILCELDSLQNIAKEIVITGINLSAFGRDINSSLTQLIIALKDYDYRIRFGSLEVRVITKEFLDATKMLKNFCPHFHLSLQSGDDDVLMQMNRHYSTAEYKNAVNLIRDFYPNAGITTDIIVGFPTETEEQFENCMNFAKDIEFSDIHIFSYSSREGTKAGKLKVLDSKIVANRQKRLKQIKLKLVENFLSKQIGIEQKVLFETEDDGLWCGHTSNYVKVYYKGGEHNKILPVIPTKPYKDGLIVD